MSFTVVELIQDFRRQVDDLVEPYLWSDEEIRDYFDEAEDDFCERTNALYDQLNFDYVAGQEWLSLPSYITDIRAAADGNYRVVAVRNRAPWEEAIGRDDYGIHFNANDWPLVTGPTVIALITDLRLDQVRLYPIPSVNGSIILDVYRRPVVSLAERPELEVTDRKQQRVIFTEACALAYGKHDAEAYNPKMAEALHLEYLQACDELARSARRRRRDNQTVGYGGL